MGRLASVTESDGADDELPLCRDGRSRGFETERVGGSADSYGIPREASPWLKSERMYPAQADRIARGSDGSITAVSKGHIAQYGPDGSITIKSSESTVNYG